MMSAEFLGMWLRSKQGELARVFLMHVFMHSTAICCCLWFARLRVQCSRDRCWAMYSAKSGDLSTQKKKLHPQRSRARYDWSTQSVYLLWITKKFGGQTISPKAQNPREKIECFHWRMNGRECLMWKQCAGWGQKHARSQRLDSEGENL